MKNFKKLLSSLLLFVLTFNVFTVNPLAETQDKVSIEKFDPEEFGYQSRLEKLDDFDSYLEKYDLDLDKTVRVLVELDEKPVVEKEDVLGRSFFRTAKSVEKKLAEESVKLEKDQLDVVDKIADFDEEVKVNTQLTYLTNSVSIDLKAENLKKVKALSGVKRVFIEREYFIPTPQMDTSNDLVNAPTVWEDLGYKGEGMTVAVLDTGLDTDHPAFNQAPVNPKYTKDDVLSLLEGSLIPNEELVDTYYNEKVPFAYDYAEESPVVKPTVETAGNLDHGTHVAGTVAGNYKGFKGVSPEAQVLVFKVFDKTGGGAYDSVIARALEDAVRLDVDAINMSLGSDAGFDLAANDYTNDLYNRINDKGILVSASAGNSTSNAVENIWGTDLTLTDDPDHGIVGSPSVYYGPMSIASSNNTHVQSTVFKVGDVDVNFVDTTNSIKQLEGEVVEYVVVEGVGNVEDFEKVDVKDKVAFVQRGEIAFTEKIENAEDFDAKAIIVFGSDDTLVNMAVDGTSLPSAYITLSTALEVFEDESNEVDFTFTDGVVEYDKANEPSDFSSSGTTPDLNIKPELTAPGGQIYSTLPTQGASDYGTMSGTSMAAPHVAGGAALVKQYLKKTNPYMSNKELMDTMDALLMSTANIINDSNDTPYPVRKQGAGVMDLAKAIQSSVYLSVDSNQNDDKSTRPKLEVKDSKEGVYTLKFDVNNFGDEDLEFDVSTLVTLPDTGGFDYGEDIGVKFFMLEENKVVDYVEFGTVKVKANSNKSLEYSLKLNDNAKAYAEAYFENGVYVEGYVNLTERNGNNPDLNIPYLGFYGDWEKAPIFDRANYLDVNGEEYESLHEHIFASDTIHGTLPFGVSLFDETLVDYTRMVVSPDNWLFNQIDLILLGQLRSAKTMDLNITDSKGNVVYNQSKENMFKTYYGANYGQIVTATHFIGQGFDEVVLDDLKDGKYTLSFEADLGYTQGVDDVLSYDIYVDRTAPELSRDENGTFHSTDDNFMLLTSIGVIDLLTMDVENINWIDEYHTPYGDVNTHSYDLPFEVLSHNQGFVIEAYDAGYNADMFLITPEVVEYPEDKFVALELDETYQIDSKDHDANYTSSNEDVVIVDENGLVTAVDYGEATITGTTNNSYTWTTTVKVVENKGLVFEELDKTVSRNDAFTPVVKFNDTVVPYEDLTFEYEKDALKETKEGFKALKAGDHYLSAFYEVEVENKGFTTDKEVLDNDLKPETEVVEAVLVVSVLELDTTKHQAALKKAENYNENDYSEKSFAVFKEALEALTALLENEDATQTQLDTSLQTLKDAMANLKRSVTNLEASYDVKVGETITLSPNPSKGTWSYDKGNVEVTKELTQYKVKALKEGSHTLTFTNEDKESFTVTLNVTKDEVKPEEKPNKPVVDIDDKKSSVKPDKSNKDKVEEVKTTDNTNNSEDTLPTTGSVNIHFIMGSLLVLFGLVLFGLVILGKNKKEEN